MANAMIPGNPGYPYYSYQVNNAPYPYANGGAVRQMTVPPVSGALPQYYQAPTPQTQTDIKWVQGRAGAKAYVVDPGKSVILMDSESDHFYIKSADPSGMPLPLRVFAYKEEAEDVGTSGSPDMSKYLTKDDVKQILEEYLGPMNKENK